MTTILFAFFVSLAIGILLTPLARWAGHRFGALDMPDERKVHAQPIPRIGGVAILSAMAVTLGLVSLVPSQTAGLLEWSSPLLGLVTGAGIVFFTGLADDLRGLSAPFKLLMQVIAASTAYALGLQIQLIGIDGHILYLGIFSYLATVIWFLVFINAVNLADGLDGLAGGIVFFAALLMVLLSVLGERYLPAMLFAALAGATLGFLRYNFNPASIFLGDSGSYLLGFSMAGLAIFGGSKSQVGTAVLIPAVALGLPLFDTLLSTLRRFIVGKRIFGPDKQHIHHRLLALGLNTRRAVLLIYAITVLLCAVSFLLVNLRDERAALVLALVGFGALIFVRKLGYFDYLHTGRILSWLRDLYDESGISPERRSFLDVQIAISESRTLDQLWEKVGKALELMEMDVGMLYLAGLDADTVADYDRRTTAIEYASVCLRKQAPEYVWTRPSMERSGERSRRCLFRIELPLERGGSRDDAKMFTGTLVLLKDTSESPLGHYAIKRIEHLRRVVVHTLEGMDLPQIASSRNGAGHGVGEGGDPMDDRKVEDADPAAYRSASRAEANELVLDPR